MYFKCAKFHFLTLFCSEDNGEKLFFGLTFGEIVLLWLLWRWQIHLWRNLSQNIGDVRLDTF